MLGMCRMEAYDREREPKGELYKIQNLRRSHYNKGNSKLSFNEA